jgi:hypothetical protein
VTRHLVRSWPTRAVHGESRTCSLGGSEARPTLPEGNEGLEVSLWGRRRSRTGRICGC